MRGLILKDLLQLKRYSKILVLMFIFFTAISVINSDFSFASTIIIVLSSMMTITSFAYDNLGKWDGFALAMPIKRSKVVLSKYLLAVILCFAGTVIAFLASLFISIVLNKKFDIEALVTIGAGIEVGLIFVSLMIPLIYKFGVEKSRYMVMIVILIPVLLELLLKNYGITMPSEEQIIFMLKLSPIVTFLLMLLSYLLSSCIYDKKEF